MNSIEITRVINLVDSGVNQINEFLSHPLRWTIGVAVLGLALSAVRPEPTISSYQKKSQAYSYRTYELTSTDGHSVLGSLEGSATQFLQAASGNFLNGNQLNIVGGSWGVNLTP